MQKDKYTLEAQRRITKELAEKNGATIIQTYEDEALSGATIDNRPSILEMIEDIKKIKPDYIISTDQDRISRGNDFWYIKNILVKSHTSIITEKEGIIEMGDETKDALSDMINVFSKLERKMIAKRVARGIEQKMREGSHFGLEPIGYTRKNKQIIVNEYSVYIKKIFELAMSGISVSAIVKYMHNNNYKTQFGCNFSGVTIKSIIQNPVYIGKIKYKGEIYGGKHEPIIDEVTFMQANRKL
jgi:site-specific DNA recombinase